MRGKQFRLSERRRDSESSTPQPSRIPGISPSTLILNSSAAHVHRVSVLALSVFSPSLSVLCCLRSCRFPRRLSSSQLCPCPSTSSLRVVLVNRRGPLETWLSSVTRGASPKLMRQVRTQPISVASCAISPKVGCGPLSQSVRSPIGTGTWNSGAFAYEVDWTPIATLASLIAREPRPADPGSHDPASLLSGLISE